MFDFSLVRQGEHTMPSSVRHAVVILAAMTSLGAPTAAFAQSTIFRLYSKLPAFFHNGADTTFLKAACGKEPHRSLRPGMTVTRQETVGGKVLLYQEVIGDSVPLVSRAARPFRPILGSSRFKGNLAVDKSDASKLRVNPWRFVNDAALAGVYGDRPAAPEDTIRGAALRQCELFYELQDRTSVSFRSRGITAGAVVIPFRVRPGYEAHNRTIEQEVSTSVNVGVYGGFTWARTQYFYAKNADNALRDSYRFTLGPLLAFGAGSADTESTKSAREPLPSGRKVGFLTVSPGAAALVNVRGLDLGGFVGHELALGGAEARKWDRHGHWWWGFGLGYMLFK